MNMKIINTKRCFIGEGPIWNEKEELLYFTNGIENEIHIVDVKNEKTKVRKTDVSVFAMAFDVENRLYVSCANGVFLLNDDNTLDEIYDTRKHKIMYGNDMKVGPDGAIYIGTMSSKRKGVSDKLDGKLYRIDKNGDVRVLLDNLILSNGMEWSVDEKFFYHTDSDTNIIKEYTFDASDGSILHTGRSVEVRGVDGFTVDEKNDLYVACWGQGHIAVVDTEKLAIKDYIEIPADIPASCGFCGAEMDVLAITTATYNCDLSKDKNAGYPILMQMKTKGRRAYLFGEKCDESKNI